MKEYTVNVRSLVEFLLRKGDITPSDAFFSPERAQLGAEIHRKLQKKAKEVCDDYAAEKPLRIELMKDGVKLLIEGRCDGLWFKDDILVVDEIKTIEFSPTDDNIPDPVHIAQALCYAAMLETIPEYASDKVCLRVFYYSITDSKESESHTIMTKEEIEEAFKQLTDEYFKWICPDAVRYETLQSELADLSFPHKTYRKGQRELAVSIYKTITESTDSNLYASAPTGIGKTVSVLFPSLKSMCKEVSGVEISKIFYLTAANSGSASPENTVFLLSEQLPSLQSITLTSKEKICPFGKECSPETCPRAKGHYERVNACIYEALACGGIFTKKRILEFADKYNVCPFELQLDISLSCDVIIGDYNYLFDPDARLRRFFGDFKNNSGKISEKQPYIYLIDEAHNLPDRAREMYSASISARRIAEFRKLFKPENKIYKKIKQSLADLFDYITNTGLYRTGQKDVSLTVDQTVIDLCEICCDNAYDLLRKKYVRKDIRKQFLDYYFEMKFFYETARRFDINYRAYSDPGSQSPQVNRYKNASYTLFCVNPSALIQSAASSGRTAVFFSGTMQPFEFCVEAIGGEKDKDRLIKIPSPFPPENKLSIMAADVSTVYSRRSDYYSTVVKYIHLIKEYADVSCGGKGNFIFFFSSYKYMDDIAELLEKDFKDTYVSMQPRNSDPKEREDFINGFKTDPDGIHIGMCVLGGVFSEGIDLPGSRLSGVVIVGVGMPMVCSERDIISDYHEHRMPGSGFLNAYLYPGMNKVLQAAGRVIRTMDDKGFVIFLDSRYFTRNYAGLFPEDYIMNKAKNFDEVKRLLFDFKL